MAIALRRSIALVVASLACLGGPSSRAMAGSAGENVAVTYKVNQKRTECIYDKFDQSDLATFSVFIVEALKNGQPKTTITFEGPVAGSAEVMRAAKEAGFRDHSDDGEDAGDNIGRQLHRGLQSLWPFVQNKMNNPAVINRSIKVDWSHAGESEDALAMREQHEAEKREYYRNKSRAAAEGEEEDLVSKEKFSTRMMTKIEPLQETNAIRLEGWYRLCVKSDYHALLVEMELRSGRRMGGVNRGTGHVYTWEERETLDAEKEIDDGPDEVASSSADSMSEEQRKLLEKEIEDQVKATDLHASKDMARKLNSIVGEMKRKHQEFHHRIRSHKASAERNHASMVWSSKLETLLYMVITGVQVYTIRKWLLGNSLLGS